MHRALGVAWLAALAFVAAPAVAQPRATADSARIVPWVSIGEARLGETVAAVKRSYGTPTRVKDLSRSLPAGTRWYGHRVVERTFRVPGGELWVRTVDGRVRAVGTTSARYVTPRGIRVGLRIHSRCQTNTSGDCDPYWRGFVFRECTGWVYGRRGLVVSLGAKRDRVETVAFGDPNALVICF